MIANSQITYVGVDIGGSLTKLCLLSPETVASPFTEVQVDGRHLKLHMQTFLDIASCAEWIRVNPPSHSGKIVLAATGGAVRHQSLLKELLPEAQLHILSEFDCNVKGIEFIRKAGLPITLTEFTKLAPHEVQLSAKETTLSACELPLEFISLGSGVNFNKVGEGPDGLERLKADPKPSINGYTLEGTCLGGSYIFGLVSLLSQQRDGASIVKLIQQNEEFAAIKSELLTNLMQSALTLSVIHEIPTIIPSGNILNLGSLAREFERAMQLCQQPLPFKRSLITLNHLEGFLGCAGAVFSRLTSQ